MGRKTVNGVTLERTETGWFPVGRSDVEFIYVRSERWWLVYVDHGWQDAHDTLEGCCDAFEEHGGELSYPEETPCPECDVFDGPKPPPLSNECKVHV